MNIFHLDVIDQLENGNALAEVEHYNRIDKSMVPRWLKKEGNQRLWLLAEPKIISKKSKDNQARKNLCAALSKI